MPGRFLLERTFMNRYKLREHTFKLLFLAEFYNEEERAEQIELYFEREELADADRDARDTIICKYENVLENIEEIDNRINSVASNWKTDRMGKVDLSILRLAVYEMNYDENVPTGVAINEAVELGKKYGQDESPAFINGILAKLC